MDTSSLSPQAKPKAVRLFYIAKTQNFMQLGIVSMVFTYLTLGGYYFKAMTDCMAYQVKCLAFTKTLRLYYTGKPLDLFKAVAPALGILIVTAGLIQWAVVAKSYLAFVVLVAILYGTVQYGLFCARRYHLSHIKINHIPLSVTASVLDQMKIVMKRAALNIVTIGYAIPQSDLDKWAAFVSKLQVGTASFSFSGSAKSLRWIHMVSFYIPFLMATVFLLMAAQVSPDAEGQAQTGKAFLMVLFYVSVILGFLGRAWYQAALRIECLRGLKLGSLRFKSTVTGLEMFKTRALNLAVLVGSLGLGYPFLQHRNLDLWCKTTIIGGDLNSILLASVPQTKESSS